MGNIDFAPFVQALSEIDYQDSVSAELGFQYTSDPDPAVKRTYTALVGLFGAEKDISLGGGMPGRCFQRAAAIHDVDPNLSQSPLYCSTPWRFLQQRGQTKLEEFCCRLIVSIPTVVSSMFQRP